MDKAKKTGIIQEYRKNEKDSGSTDVQVAILTARINQLTGHMATAKHDYHTQRGLLQMVGKRRRLLNYLSKEDVDRYHALITKLGLRK